MAETWNDNYLIFNDSIIEESNGSPRWSSIRMASENDEVRRKFRSRPLWNLDIGNLWLTAPQYEELLAFQWLIEGMVNPFLVRNVRNCLFQDAKGRPALIGVSDGESDPGSSGTSVYRLQKTRPLQNRITVEYIQFPNIDYPALLDMNGREWAILPKLEIWTGGDGSGINRGTLVPYANLEVDRNNGLVQIPTPPTGNRIEAYGGFYTLMVCNEDEIPVKPDGGGFKIERGVTFSEPTGGE